MIVERVIRLENRLGLHVRPAAQLAELASKFNSEISIIKDKQQANVKSIIELLTLAAAGGTSITIKADGQDAKKAVEALEQLINNKFGED